MPPSFKPLFSSSSMWTCRTCLLRNRATVWTRPPLSRTKQTRSISIRAADFQVSRDRIEALFRENRKLWRWVLILGGGIGVASLVAFTEPGRHYSRAGVRTWRVMDTLFWCISDYRKTLKMDEKVSPEEFEELLKACHKRSAERTLSALEKNGSIFIKLGQHLSSMNYLLPKEWCDTFIPLQDKCPVSSLDSIKAMVLKDTGKSLDEFFSEFEPFPIGAASLAQVHRATIRETGERVAVKVQHPTLDEWAHIDLALTRFSFESLAYWFPEYDLTWLSEEMEVSLPKELDFAHEAHNATVAREYFSHVPDAPVIIPRVLWAQRRILVMEYVPGHRPDDLDFLDSHSIDRDEVSAALARIFNEMIFGEGAPLHCDPHGGNIAIRHRRKRWGEKANFDVVLYDHGLYRELPSQLRHAYARLWLAVLDNDVPRMRTYAKEVAGISDEHFELFASAITGRDFSVLSDPGAGVTSVREKDEKKAMGQALGEGGLLSQLTRLLAQVPRVLLLVLKTNDLTRSLDDNLHTRQGSARTFLILGRYASRCVYSEELEGISGSVLWPRNLLRFLSAFARYARVELKLSVYESWLSLRRLMGMKPMVVESGGWQ
ncbi:ABC1-domain-containing protein [Microthyrium microscopicum]|uniref:ABC1-domain-containing protein n=1 Tax=Microthyrium microscopicum TaxID=703497 RepID=A0A6A6UQP3_9PEZI|nr:ABC1-domain-containing protein [Microthyrium microscopicum]